ncbi:MAG: alanine:cation symporter family protein, partial [bacterium]|nr:alanine:cation symporter family protein [bacterium]
AVNLQIRPAPFRSLGGSGYPPRRKTRYVAIAGRETDNGEQLSFERKKEGEYLFGTGVIRPYRLLWVLAVMVGSVASLKMVWSFADITNGLMAIPNFISRIVLNKVIVSETREHLWNARA